MNASATVLRAVESDSLIESSFRRLLASIEAEREKIRSTWQQIEQERDGTTSELERLREDTEAWCYEEKTKIDAEWKRLDKLSDRMGKLWPEASAARDIVHINCSGSEFSVPRSILCAVEDSNLSRLFSDEFIHTIQKDATGRFYVDFNPQCFGLIVDYLQNRRLRPDAPTPIVPAKLAHSMDLLAEALQFKPFLHTNKIITCHGTSLFVTGSVIQATHPGWQVISAEHPLPLAGASYFEVEVLDNPNTSGGLAIGVCGHIPQGPEVHCLRLSASIMYNSNNGLIGDCIESEDVAKGLKLSPKDVLGIKNDVANRSIIWYHNRLPVGKSVIQEDFLDKMRTLYPVFALYVPDQRIRVNFNPVDPSADPGAA